jgi:hypothetical protein
MKKSIASNHPSQTIPSDISILRKSPTGIQPKVPSHLKISPEAKELLELHLSVVELDKYVISIQVLIKVSQTHQPKNP